MQCPACPRCQSRYTYVDRGIHICPQCAHEWESVPEKEGLNVNVAKDINGSPQPGGDTIAR